MVVHIEPSNYSRVIFLKTQVIIVDIVIHIVETCRSIHTRMHAILISIKMVIRSSKRNDKFIYPINVYFLKNLDLFANDFHGVVDNELRKISRRLVLFLFFVLF